MSKFNTAVVIPNWNGLSTLGSTLDSLKDQSLKAACIVVDNGSIDGSVEFISKNYPDVEIIKNNRNLGFAGGVNQGIKAAIKSGNKYVALLNNDAVADKDWLKNLVETLEKQKDAAVATSKILSDDKEHLDSTGDYYTNWGLVYPRGRGEKDHGQYDSDKSVFGASGGASLYRIEAFKQVGLFDEDFFAYYEDVDISFRFQLAGWKVAYVPSALAYHQIGATSSKIKGFTTYQTLKNLPQLLIKNVPSRYLWSVGWRFTLAYLAFFLSALSRGQFWPVLKGILAALWFTPKKLIQRFFIQNNRRVSSQYIWQVIVHDLPPNAKRLRKLRDALKLKK